MKIPGACGGLFFVTLSAALLFLPDQAAGQSSGAVCMAGTTKYGQGRSFTFYLAEARIPDLEARGFRSALCSTAAESFTEFRSRACGLSQTAPPAFQQAFERVYGIGLGELCTLANEAG